MAAEPGFEDEGRGDLVDDLAAGGAVFRRLTVAGAVEETVGFSRGVALVEEFDGRRGSEVFGEVRSKCVGEHFGFGRLGAGFPTGVNGKADEDRGNVVAADEAGNGLEVGFEGGAINRQQGLRGVAKRIR